MSSVVVKFLRSELATDPAVRARFAAEIRAVRRLCHPNLVRFVDAGDGYLVMDHARGVPLGTVIAESGPFAVSRVAAIGEQLLRALAHAHARGVIHADVKSDNVLLDAAGGDHVTLIDFGVTRLLDEPTVVEDPMLSGTPEYMAPEVILGGLPGPAADIYAVGVILYELLTGATPFGGGASPSILARHVDEDVVPPSTLVPDRAIPVALEHVVMRALAKDPWLRFPSASSFAVALHDATRDTDGTSLPLIDTPWVAFSTEAKTRDWSIDELPEVVRAKRLARGTRPASSDRVARAKAAIGAALVRGSPYEIADGYLASARALVDDHRLDAATAELQEALDVLTPGHSSSEPVIPVWPILLTLAALHDGLGDRPGHVRSPNAASSMQPEPARRSARCAQRISLPDSLVRGATRCANACAVACKT